MCGWLHEEAADDGGLRGADVCGGEQLRQAVAEVVDLPVQATDIAACLLQHPRRRHLHVHTYSTVVVTTGGSDFLTLALGGGRRD